MVHGETFALSRSTMFSRSKASGPTTSSDRLQLYSQSGNSSDYDHLAHVVYRQYRFGHERFRVTYKWQRPRFDRPTTRCGESYP